MTKRDKLYNEDEMWALHLVDECPWDCPFCFDDDEDCEDYDEPQEWDDEY